MPKFFKPDEYKNVNTSQIKMNVTKKQDTEQSNITYYYNLFLEYIPWFAK